ncbi:MAG: hypothetical protein KGJ13_11095 [Patescibacteria group bacterium]|nr:hypothetical protein [Patescibacteria group bacterium]
MDCPSCKDSFRVIVSDSRPIGGTIRRRRKCTHCGARWTTYEISDEQIDSAIQHFRFAEVRDRLCDVIAIIDRRKDAAE